MPLELFHGRPHIDFVKNRWVCFTISGCLFAVAIFALATRGINYAIDFTGGVLLQVAYETPQTPEGLRADLAKAGFPEAAPEHYTSAKKPTFAIRIKGTEQDSHEKVDQLVKALEAADPAKKFTVERKEFVGPVVGRHLFKQAMFAIFFSLVGIVIYVAFRFSNLVWGVAAILSIGHDVLAMFGLFALMRMEFNLVLVAAALTIAGYSNNDTIVVFDRMREKMRMSRDLPLGEIVNLSINETLSRTIITSLTVLLTLLALAFLGGPVLRDFSIALIFGVVEGTYSSIAVAAPIVYQWEAGGWKVKASQALPGAAKPGQRPAEKPAPGPTPQPQPVQQALSAEPGGPAENERRSRREKRKNRR